MIKSAANYPISSILDTEAKGELREKDAWTLPDIEARTSALVVEAMKLFAI